MNGRPTVGSLFSGVGLLDLGLEWAGWDTRWFCEADPWCRRILAKRFPGRWVYTDARSLPTEHAARVDLLAGGFPCQPVSLAGKGLAQGDPRWLWPAFERAIRRLRPSLVLVENVPGLLARGLGDVLRDLAALGFDAAWTCFGAADLGAPHLRRRLWLCAAHPDRIDVRVEPGRWFGPGWADEALAGDHGASRTVADADGERRDGRSGELGPCGRGKPAHGGGDKADSHRLVGRACTLASVGQKDPGRELRGPDWWSAEPDVGRVAHGVPARLDRLRALGNGVVPQCAELVGRRLMKVAAVPPGGGVTNDREVADE